MIYEPAIQKAIVWIESHLHEDISDDDINAVTGFSKFHFHRIFQSTMGMSLSEYLRMRRLTNAAGKLLYTEEKIIDIAFYYRFESQESFTRAFKKIYQLPPGRYRKTMSLMMKKKEEETMIEQTIKGWFITGSHPSHYEIELDNKNVHQGSASGHLKSNNVQTHEEFATMMQHFKADKFRGEKRKLTGFIQTKNVEQYAGLWMRIDSTSGEMLQFDNMQDRPITGTNNWKPYSIVLDIPENSAIISFGILLAGTGEVWLDGLRFEAVDKSTPTTHNLFEDTLLEEPANLNFEE